MNGNELTESVEQPIGIRTRVPPEDNTTESETNERAIATRTRVP